MKNVDGLRFERITKELNAKGICCWKRKGEGDLAIALFCARARLVYFQLTIVIGIHQIGVKANIEEARDLRA